MSLPPGPLHGASLARYHKEQVAVVKKLKTCQIGLHVLSIPLGFPLVAPTAEMADADADAKPTDVAAAGGKKEPEAAEAADPHTDGAKMARPSGVELSSVGLTMNDHIEGAKILWRWHFFRSFGAVLRAFVLGCLNRVCGLFPQCCGRSR